MPMLQVRLDDQTRTDAESVLEKIGLTLPEAVRLFLARVVADQAIPFNTRLATPIRRGPPEQTRRPAHVTRALTPLEELEQELSATFR